MSLFEEHAARARPLAEELRPTSLDEVLGQDHARARLEALATAPRTIAMIMTGPPGVGKTTIASLLARARGEHLVELHATDTGVRELRQARAEAAQRARHGDGTLWFVDEVHRFGRTQLDLLLAPIERGEISFIGATTENPAVTLSPALLSRCDVIRLRALEPAVLRLVAARALAHLDVVADEPAIEWLVTASRGDARALLRILERAAPAASHAPLSVELLERITETTALGLDDSTHYELASALIKSMRQSRPTEAIRWLAAALAAGEDPRFIARRLAIFASEDVGLADPEALVLATAAADTVERIGMPEARITLAHAVLYLARAPKSREAYDAIEAALAEAATKPRPTVPEDLRGAITGIERRRGITPDA